MSSPQLVWRCRLLTKIAKRLDIQRNQVIFHARFLQLRKGSDASLLQCVASLPFLHDCPSSVLWAPLLCCGDGLEDLEGVGGKFTSSAHLFRQGTPLIFASLLEGNESTDWPKVTWVYRELLLSGFDHLFSSICIRWHSELGPYHYDRMGSLWNHQQLIYLSVLHSETCQPSESWELMLIRGDNNWYGHKYASPSTLIVVLLMCTLKVCPDSKQKCYFPNVFQWWRQCWCW